ncbi:Lrp/AsnC family transcriptional regulator [Kangsaoukella pontilimi]|uniref:Lrp/AsnC family transcriptional regulator n=1 Tax=Kangsaoukella pontilimi TaxID=2691042 RepID=UPI003872ADD0
MQIDETDRDILRCLRENARTPVAAIAKRLDLARSTVQSRLERLESSGAIEGYTVRVSSAVRARPIRASALLEIEPRKLVAVMARLRQIDSIESVHTTSGRIDLLVTIAARTTEELDKALDTIGEIDGVTDSESLIHLTTKLDRR